MNKRDMLENLINYYTDGNKAKFAVMIGITPQLVSNWIKRSTFDAETIYMKCKDVSADWLLSGRGEMIRDKQNDNISHVVEDDKSSELLEVCKQLISNYKQRDSIIDKLVSMTTVK